jgi:hypothetical protein
MVDSFIKPDATLLQLRRVAVQRMLGVTDVTLLNDDTIRSAPARVYPAVENAEDWIVEPPANGTSAIAELKTFTGRAALLRALEYAYCNYHSTLYLSR